MRKSKNDSNEFMKFVEEYEQATIEDLDKLLEHKLNTNTQINAVILASIAIIIAATSIAINIIIIAINIIIIPMQTGDIGGIIILVLIVLIVGLILNIYIVWRSKKLDLKTIKTIYKQYHEAKERLLKKYEYKMVAFYELEDYLRVGWNIVAQSDNQFLIRRRV